MSEPRSEVDVLNTILKMKDQTLADVIAKMEEAAHEAIFYRERDTKLHERIDALEDELFKRDRWAARWKQSAKSLYDYSLSFENGTKVLSDKIREQVTELAALESELADLSSRHAVALDAIAAAEVSRLALEADREKLLCENDIYEQCIANIVDTKPGGSIEGQMIAATKLCGQAEQRAEDLELKLAALQEDAQMLAMYIRKTLIMYICCELPSRLDRRDILEACNRILEATKEQG